MSRSTGTGVAGRPGKVRAPAPGRVGGVVAGGHLDEAQARLAGRPGRQARPPAVAGRRLTSGRTGVFPHTP